MFEGYNNELLSFQKLSLQQKDHQVSPSRWNKRMDPSIYCQTFDQLMLTKSGEFLNKGYHVETVKYGEKEKEVYDIIKPDYVTDNTPVVVFFHGGYWKEGSRNHFHAPSEAIVEKGGLCVCVGYNLVPQVDLSEIMQEAARAIEHLLTITFKNSRRIYFWAHCAGVVNAIWGCCHANLSETALQAIKGFMLFSGVYDLKPLSLTSDNDTLNMSRNEVENFSLVEKSNLEALFSRFRHCDFLLAMNQHEPSEFFRQNNFFKKLLRAKNLRVQEVEFEGWDHMQCIEMMCQQESLVTQINLEFVGLSKAK